MRKDRVLRSFGPSAGRDELPLIREFKGSQQSGMSRSSSLPIYEQQLFSTEKSATLAKSRV